MKILVFLGLMGFAAYLGIHGDHSGDSISKFCTNLVAGVVFLLAFWIPSKMDKKE